MNTDPENPSQIDVEASPVPYSLQRKGGLLFGRFGLRAGWGIAIFVLCWLIFTLLGNFFGLAVSGHLKELMAARAYAQAHPHDPRPRVHLVFTPGMIIVMDGIIFFGLLGLCWLFSRAERRRLGTYGIGGNRWRDVFPGALWGLLMMSALVALLRALHLLVFDSRALFGGAIFLFGMKWLLAFCLVGLAEEYMFRGYMQFTLMRGVWGLAERLAPAHPRSVAFWIAAVILSLAFGALHIGNSGETHFGLVAVVLAGLTFSYALWRTGSLWWGVGFHVAWDWAQSFLYGVADSGNVSAGRLFITHPAGNPLLSGGPTGPEGSVFVCVALALTVVILRFTRPGAQPSLEEGSLHTALPNTSS